MGKGIHIVFQVVNFLRDQKTVTKLNLSPVDRLILILLASHNGQHGIFPSIPTIAKEVGVSPRQVIRRLSHLASVNLISKEISLGKRTKYSITLPKNNHDLSTGGDQILNKNECGSLPKKLSTTSDTHVTSPPLTSDTHVTGTSDTHVTTPVTPMSHINNQVSNQERESFAREARLSLFSPTKAQKQKCIVQKINIEIELQKFIAYSKSKKITSSNWEASFDLWLQRATEYREKNKSGEEVKSTVEFFTASSSSYNVKSSKMPVEIKNLCKKLRSSEKIK